MIKGSEVSESLHKTTVSIKNEAFKKIKIRYKDISSKLLQDAKNQGGSIYRMNAPYADYYGFNANSKGDEISAGEFLSESALKGWKYEYLLELKTKELFKVEDAFNK